MVWVRDRHLGDLDDQAEAVEPKIISVNKVAVSLYLGIILMPPKAAIECTGIFHLVRVGGNFGLEINEKKTF